MRQFGDEVTVFTTNCFSGEAFNRPELPRMPVGIEERAVSGSGGSRSARARAGSSSAARASPTVTGFAVSTAPPDALRGADRPRPRPSVSAPSPPTWSSPRRFRSLHMCDGWLRRGPSAGPACVFLRRSPPGRRLGLPALLDLPGDAVAAATWPRPRSGWTYVVRGGLIEAMGPCHPPRRGCGDLWQVTRDEAPSGSVSGATAGCRDHRASSACTRASTRCSGRCPRCGRTARRAS